MSKYEEEVFNIVANYPQKLPNEGGLREDIFWLLAKQRTQLLARVREEVVGKKPVNSDKDSFQVVCNKVGMSRLIGIQLKKLEIISEEVK